MALKAFTRRDQLMAAALEEFAVMDFEGASLNTIIKSAGISKGVFYYHFENKEALYLALLDEANRQKWAFIRDKAALDSEGYQSLDLFERFLYQAKLGMAFANSHPKYHQLSMQLLKEKGNPIYDTALRHVGTDGSTELSAMISEAIARGELRSDFNEVFVTKLLTHLFQSFYDIFDVDTTEDAQKLLEHYVTFMRFGLTAEHQ
jgi:AcrR family transcriptional regulator